MTTKTCSRCKETKDLTQGFGPRPSNTGGYKGICRGCETKRAGELYRKDPDKHKARNRELGLVPSARFSRFKKRCVYSNQQFELSFEQWASLVLDRSCHYCEGALNPKGCGLDRKDNTVGYVLPNVVACCKECNRIKGHMLTYEEMLSVAKLLKEMRS